MNSETGKDRCDNDHLRRRLQSMDNFRFEHLVADLWEERGWNTKVEQQSNDAGIDVRATQESPYKRKLLIQAKRYSDDNPIGGPDIQQYSALKRQEHDVDEVIIVTTGRYTGAAEERARELNVKTIDGNDLVTIIDNLDAYDIVERYIGPPSGTNEPSRGFQQQTQSASPVVDVRKYLDQDIESYQDNEEYRTIRAFEKERDRVWLNPYDANLLGIFDSLPKEVTNAKFRETKRERAILKDDLHLTQEDELFVEDLTYYIGSSTIDTNENKNVIGIIERGVKDGEWAVEDKYENLMLQRKIKKYSQGAWDSIKNIPTWFDDILNNNPTKISATQTQQPVSTDEVGNMNKESYDQEVITQRETEFSDSSSPDEVSHRDTDTISSQSTLGYKILLSGVVFYVLSYLVIGLEIGGAIESMAVLSAWLTVPLGIYLDGKRIGILSQNTNEIIVYILISIIPGIGVIGGIAYLYRRYSNNWG